MIHNAVIEFPLKNYCGQKFVICYLFSYSNPISWPTHLLINLSIHIYTSKSINQPFTHLPNHLHTTHIHQATCKSIHLPPCQRTYLPFNLSPFYFPMLPKYSFWVFDNLTEVQALTHSVNISQTCNISTSSSYLIHIFYCRSAAAFT